MTFSSPHPFLAHTFAWPQFAGIICAWCFQVLPPRPFHFRPNSTVVSFPSLLRFFFFPPSSSFLGLAEVSDHLSLFLVLFFLFFFFLFSIIQEEFLANTTTASLLVSPPFPSCVFLLIFGGRASDQPSKFFSPTSFFPRITLSFPPFLFPLLVTNLRFFSRAFFFFPVLLSC